MTISLLAGGGCALATGLILLAYLLGIEKGLDRAKHDD